MEGNWALVGVETTVIGMAVVFLILVILMFCITALDKIVDKSAQKKALAGSAKNELPAAAAAPAVAAAPAATKSAPAAGIDPKTVAAIMAAVAAAAGGKALKFVAIKRVNSVPGPWAASAANDLINTRQSYL